MRDKRLLVLSGKGDYARASNPLFYHLLLMTLVLLCLLVHVGLPDTPPRGPTTPLAPKPRRCRRSTEPKPFAGLIHQPRWEACEQGPDTRSQTPGVPPPGIPGTRGRKRSVDTHAHFCPDPDCSAYGRRGRGNLRANGQPGGKPGRQFPWVSGHGYFEETTGTIFHGKRASPELSVWVIAGLAEG